MIDVQDTLIGSKNKVVALKSNHDDSPFLQRVGCGNDLIHDSMCAKSFSFLLKKWHSENCYGIV